MDDWMDFNDVRAMVTKAVADEKWSRLRHVEDLEKDLRREFRNEVMELREELGEMMAEVHKALETERALRATSVQSLANVLDARTEHVV